MSQGLIYTLNCRGTLLPLDRPRIMGILNVTPDSFSDGGEFNTVEKAISHARSMLEQGADIIDIGGYSSRPNAIDISIEEEAGRILPVIEALREHFPASILSVDTFRSEVAKQALDRGVHIVNDISGGEIDPQMIPMVASMKQVPYIMMHMQGRPQTMQQNPHYEEIVQDVWMYFVQKIKMAQAAGLTDLVVDPGFGFGKTIRHNYQLLQGLGQFQELGYPILVGLSRKSFIYKVLDCDPREVVAQSQVLHDHALRSGANILRVHDVKEAHKTIRLYQRMQEDGFI
ncbi:MAG: dihydropteroate synthase [Bacteroidia bacterium]|nr:dihydropteroate synthase [Bacteroidia bacterium]